MVREHLRKGEDVNQSNESLRKRENTKARLLSAATEVFTEKGFSGARIDEIVKLAGFSRGAFYSNYSSLEELLRDVLVTRAAGLLDVIQDAVEAVEDPASVKSLVEILVAIQPEGRTLYILTTEFTMFRLRNPDRADFGVADRENFSKLLSKTVLSSLDRLHRTPIIDVSNLADILVVLFLDYVARSSLNEARGGTTQYLEQIVEGILFGLSLPKTDQEPGEVTAENLAAARDLIARISSGHCGNEGDGLTVSSGLI